MRKLLTAGIFGTILSLTGANYAGASIISRGFFDEAMENYATNTALDLKANQSDFTELNTQISNSVNALKTLWNSDIGILADGFNPNKVNNDIEGAFGLVGGFIVHSMQSLTGGWYESRDNFYQGIRQLNDGWTDSNDGTTYLGVKSLNDEILWPNAFNFGYTAEFELFGFRNISTYPKGTTVKDVLLNMFADQGSTYYNGNYPKFGKMGERIFNGGNVVFPETAFYSSFNATKPPLYTLDTYDGLFGLNAKTGSYYWGPENEEYKFSNIPYFEELFPTGISPDKSIAMSDMATTILSNYTDPVFPGLAGVTSKLLNGWTDAKGGYIINPGLKGMYDGWTDSNKATYSGLNTISQDYTYILDTFGTSGLFSLFMKGGTTTFPGLPTNTILSLPELSYGVSKIGILPSGSLLGLSPDSDQIYKIADGTDTPVYPANVAEMIQQLYGAPQAGHRGIIPVIGRSMSDISQSITTRIGTLPDGKTVTDMISETDAKIGTVPDGKTVTDMISETDAKIGSWDAGYIADGTNNPLFKVWAKYLPQFTNMFQEIYLSRPTSLADLIEKLYGIRVDNSGDWGILGNIGALIDTIGLTINAISSKIGTVPDGYDSVGAALTAMKSDIDAKNLPSTSDDGQYVLTAKKVGDTITYTWVKMDLTNEEQAQ